ncbi:MAG: VCBS repeat domain-containing M23 family metallopeptidase [Patescibacteria group bacterium]
MKKLILLLILLITPIFSLAAIADNFIYPVSTWDVGSQHGEEIYTGMYHMGTDADFAQGEGAPVYAVANGVIKQVQEHTQFGLVILIEHTLTSGEKVVSLYGHLKPSDRKVSVGQSVSAGDLIGTLGNSSENGGWTPHIHFGIHKNAYTGAWVYAGHVPNPATANDWYDAETFIPEHLTTDNWSPEVSLDIAKDSIISNYEIINIYATDIGSTIDTVTLKASNNKKTWTTIGSYSGYEMYPYYFYASFNGLSDGTLYIRAVVTDEFGNKTKKTKSVIKKADASSTKYFAAIKGTGSSANVKSYYQDGALYKEFNTNKSTWTDNGDIAIGDVTGNGIKNIVIVPGKGKKVTVKIYSPNGKKIASFQAFPDSNKNGGRVATGDIDGDGKDEIIVGSGPGRTSLVKVFSQRGTLKWKSNAYLKKRTNGIDVDSGDIDGDGKDEIIVGSLSGSKSTIAIFDETGKRIKVFRAFGANYKGGVNVATGDIDQDGQDEIIVGTGGNTKGKVRVFESNGKQKEYTFIPFGSGFTGAVDVSTTDWENDGKDEIIMSQASNGEAWVKTYRYNKNQTILTTRRVFEEGFEGGARIAGW